MLYTVVQFHSISLRGRQAIQRKGNISEFVPTCFLFLVFLNVDQVQRVHMISCVQHQGVVNRKQRFSGVLGFKDSMNKSFNYSMDFNLHKTFILLIWRTKISFYKKPSKSLGKIVPIDTKYKVQLINFMNVMHAISRKEMIKSTSNKAY